MDMTTMIDVITDIHVNAMMEDETIANAYWQWNLPFVLMSLDDRILANELPMFEDVMENIDANFNINTSGHKFQQYVNERMLNRAFDRLSVLRRERLMLN